MNQIVQKAAYTMNSDGVSRKESFCPSYSVNKGDEGRTSIVGKPKSRLGLMTKYTVLYGSNQLILLKTICHSSPMPLRVHVTYIIAQPFNMNTNPQQYQMTRKINAYLGCVNTLVVNHIFTKVFP